MGQMSNEAATITTLPPGDYAIVEMFGHTKLVGRIAETERFGVKMMSLEPIVRFELMPAIYIGGSALYAVTPCSSQTALMNAPISEWSLPESLRAVIPPAMLPAPEPDRDPPEFAPRFLMDEVNEVEERADAEVAPHPKSCDCLDCTMPF